MIESNNKRVLLYDLLDMSRVYNKQAVDTLNSTNQMAERLSTSLTTIAGSAILIIITLFSGKIISITKLSLTLKTLLNISVASFVLSIIAGFAGLHNTNNFFVSWARYLEGKAKDIKKFVEEKSKNNFSKDQFPDHFFYANDPKAPKLTTGRFLSNTQFFCFSLGTLSLFVFFYILIY